MPLFFIYIWTMLSCEGGGIVPQGNESESQAQADTGSLEDAAPTTSGYVPMSLAGGPALVPWTAGEDGRAWLSEDEFIPLELALAHNVPHGSSVPRATLLGGVSSTSPIAVDLNICTNGSMGSEYVASVEDRDSFSSNGCVDDIRDNGGTVGPHFTNNPDATADTGDYRTMQCDVIEYLFDGMDSWEAAVPGLTFVDHTTQCEVLNFGVLDIITVPDWNGIVSYDSTLGDLHVQHLTLDGPAPSRSRGAAIHELGHALGLKHEQQRPDRADWMVYDASCTPSNKVQYEIKSASTPSGPFDYDSTMLYPSYHPATVGDPAMLSPLPPPGPPFVNTATSEVTFDVSYLFADHLPPGATIIKWQESIAASGTDVTIGFGGASTEQVVEQGSGSAEFQVTVPLSDLSLTTADTGLTLASSWDVWFDAALEESTNWACPSMTLTDGYQGGALHPTTDENVVWMGQTAQNRNSRSWQAHDPRTDTVRTYRTEDLVKLGISPIDQVTMWERFPPAGDLDGVPTALAEFGEDITWGDFDGDGIWDLAVSAPGTSEVIVYKGMLETSSYFGLIRYEPWKRFTDLTAMSLLAHDFTDDGKEELVIGHEDGPDRRGAVRIIKGDDARFFGEETLNWSAPADWEQDSRLGASSAVFNEPGSSNDLLVVGAPGATPDFLLDSADTGLPAAFRAAGIVLVREVQIEFVWGSSRGELNPHDATYVTGAKGAAAFGSAVAVGDFDGDGTDELFVGAPRDPSLIPSMAGPGQYHTDPSDPCGQVYYYSWDSTSSAFSSTARQTHNQRSESEFGASLVAGSFASVGSGTIDLAGGAPKDEGSEGSGVQVGRVYVFAGSPEMIGSALSPTVPTNDATGILEASDHGVTASSGDDFGASLAWGFFAGGDLSRTLAVGAPGYDDGAVNTGTAFLYAADPTSTLGVELSPDGRPPPGPANAYAGQCVAFRPHNRYHLLQAPAAVTGSGTLDFTAGQRELLLGRPGVFGAVRRMVVERTSTGWTTYLDASLEQQP